MGLFSLAKQAQDMSELAAKAASVVDGLKKADENQNGVPDGIEIFGEIQLGFSTMEQAKGHFEKAAALAGDNLEHICKELGLDLASMMPSAEKKPAEKKEAKPESK